MNRTCVSPRPAAGFLGVLRGLLVGTGLLLAPLALAQDAPARTLDAVDVVSLDNERIRITLTLSSAAPEPVVFSVDKPARLSLDLADTKLGVTERFRRIGTGKARSLALAEAQGRTRVVVELSDPVPYNIRTDGNKVIVDLQGTLVGAAPAGATGPAGVASVIQSVDFRRGEKGEGRVIVKLADPRTIVDVKEQGNRVQASFRNTDIAAELQKRLDVLDFATPVKFIDIVKDGRNTNIFLTPVAGADFEQVAYQAQNQFTIELQPIPEDSDEAKKRREQVYTGERISLSFQNIDVRALLQIIGDVSGNNVVISDGVKGDLAMRLINVPWDQALDIILRTKGLDKDQQGNVMLIAPLDEMAARNKAQGEALKQKDEGAPLRSEIIQVNYAKATDMAALLKAGNKTLLSSRGQVSVDDRTNTLLVLETRERLGEIRNLIARLDVPVRQVLIESRIVIANNDYSRSLGARFGVTAIDQVGSTFLTTSGSAAATDITTDSVDNDPTTPILIGALADRFNVNLPVAGGSRIAFGVLGSNFLVDLELSALQAEGRGEVLSTPRVVTANQKEASIEQGVEIPYQEASSSGATTVAFKKAVLSLQVKPQITPDDRIIMDLNVKNDSRGQDVSSGSGGLIPSIDTREVKTQVLVQNGETVVLGGVYQQTQNYSVTKVPLLGDVPLLGYLFRTNQTVNNKRELLIFISPKILSEGIKID
ncbi:MAG TPA: type IV pilus secretin PilQ [Verrucomicrobiae bacterium]|nr:type IV pilus secretin PilQ [Verrucomicrobiae bacterium]